MGVVDHNDYDADLVVISPKNYDSNVEMLHYGVMLLALALLPFPMKIDVQSYSYHHHQSHHVHQLLVYHSY